MIRRQISPERKGLYYCGMILAVLGFLAFGSTFVSAAMHFGDFTDFVGRSRSMFARAIIGMGLMIGGTLLMNLGRRGVAGSGLKLDPEESRTDLEPWSRMTGGMVKDAMDEAGIKLGNPPPPEELPFDERLRRLHQLRQDGLISEPEYAAAKKKILDEA